MKSPSTHHEDMLLQAFSDRLAADVGLSYPPERWPELLKALTQLAQDVRLSDAWAYMRRCLMHLPQRSYVEQLARRLSVGETYFFREPEAFDHLEYGLLPALVAKRRKTGRRLRLWSAGCSTGEEAYSLAILLQRTIPDLPDWDVVVLGTDIQPDFLATAAHGAYRDWSFRGVPDWVQGRYFDAVGQGYQRIKPEVGRIVKFRYLNLASEAGFASLDQMDLVLCRNVLMYFHPTQARRVLTRLRHALADDGCLLVSSAEVGPHMDGDFVATHAGGLPFYRKASQMQALPERVSASAQALGCETSTQTKDIKSDSATLMAQAIGHADRRALNEALGCCQAALAIDKCNAELHYLHALILEECGQLDDMKVVLKRVLFLDPGFVLARVALGRLCVRQGQDEHAARHYAQAVRLLDHQEPGALVADSGGFTAGRLREALRHRAGRGAMSQ